MTEENYFLVSRNCYIEDVEQSHIMMILMGLMPHKSLTFTYDDIGTASLIAEIYQKEIKYCPQYGAWYLWDGSRWKRQGDDGIISDKIQTLLNLLILYCDEVTTLTEDDVGKYEKYIRSIRKHTAMKNITEVLKTMVRVQAHELDSDPYILNTPLTGYDLRTGQSIETAMDKNITMRTNCNIANTLPPCARWYQFIDEIMSGDKEKAGFLQRALGYSLLGVNKEECMFVAYGAKTRNGKGTLFHAVEAAVGKDYFGNASPELICEPKLGKRVDFNAPQPALTKLVGKRFCNMQEADKDHRLDSAAIKSLTGRDTLTTRGLYEASFDFEPQFTMWLGTNHLPAVTDDTVFRSDRIWVITFLESFTEDTRDTNLKDIFTSSDNQPTILKWLFDGCMDYMQNGLNPPEVVREATREYQKRHDRIGDFIEKNCIAGEKERVLRGDLYQAYRSWCVAAERRYKPIGSTSFYAELEVRGYPVIKTYGEWYVSGLSISQNDKAKISLT